MTPALRHAIRTLLKSPGFTAVALLMLALGIGLSASSFSMANAFLLRNVPYSDPDRLVRLFVTSPQGPQGSFSPGNALELRKTTQTLGETAFFSSDALSLGESGQPVEQVNGLNVTANFFDLLGVRPSLGRGFVAGEDSPEKPHVAVITQRAWVRRYAADPAVIGRTVRLNTELFTIVGVLPRSFDAPLVWGPVEYLVPQIIHPNFPTLFKDSWFQAIARLKPGISVQQSQSEISTIATRLVREHPKENAGIGIQLTSVHDAGIDRVSRTMLWLMTGISLTMLLIACANLASLQVARAFGRSREFALRAAIGANRRQLMLPLLIESLVLSFVGGVSGLVVASWSNQLLGHFLTVNGEPGFDIPVDGRVLAFAAGASLLSGIAFGLAPAWLASRAPAAAALKEGSRGSTSGRSHLRLKNALIVGELALALALVGVASSFGFGARSFLQRQVGWNLDGLFAGYLTLPYNQYNDDTRNRTFQRALLDRLNAIPGVDQATLCTNLPLFYLGGPTPFNVEGQPPVEQGHEPLVQDAAVSASYFTALGIPLKSGEFFAPTLTEKDPEVAIVNEAFAQHFWPGQSALGHRFRLRDQQTWIQITGVVGNVKLLGSFAAPPTTLQLYRPLIQAPSRYVTLVLKSPLSPAVLTKSVRAAVATLDADLPVAQPGSVRVGFENNLSNLNLVVINLGISAIMGLLIAGIGLFGVISQLTMQRTRDIGVRMALGAQRQDIMRLILGGGIKLLVIGIAIGLPAFFALNRVVSTTMPEMPLPGLWLLALDLVVLGGAMLLACYLPARRAAGVNPMVALRAE